MSNIDLKEQISRLAPKKQTLINLMCGLGFDVQRVKLGKHAAWQFDYDQGVCQGCNQYTIRQDSLTALAIAGVISEEKLNTKDGVESALFSHLANVADKLNH